MTAAEVLDLPGPYRSAAAEYLEAGWSPVPCNDKRLLVRGVSGYAGRAVTAADIEKWSTQFPTANVALRLPRDIVALDVDAYDDKPGAATLAALVAEHGPLPPTVVATARPLPSGRYMFRVPNGTRLRSVAGPGIEVCQHHHRYVVAAPSVHHSGAEVRWVDECSGEVLDDVPEPDDVPELPWAWLEALSVSGHGDAADAVDDEAVVAWCARHTEQRRPGWLDVVLRTASNRIAAGESRHDTVLRAACQAAREATAGAYDAGRAVVAITELWSEVMDDPDRQAEVADLVGWAVGQLDTERSRTEVAAIAAKLDATDGPDSDDEEPRPTLRLRPAGTWLFEEYEERPPIWGQDDEILWADGESLLIAAPTGIGKTTLANLLIRAMVGIGDPDVLGYPVTPSGRVLYLAMDRPAQIRRAMRRLYTEADEALLDERLVIHPAPLAADLGKRPDLLVALASQAGAERIVVDSVKDAISKVSDDESGGNFNRAVQLCNAEGISSLLLHHQRKGQGGATPNRLEDVYGSSWLTAGAGSVVLLWGEAGTGTAQLLHLKTPSTPVGPLDLELDTFAGTIAVTRAWDPVAWLRNRGGSGNVPDAARAMSGSESKPAREKARRKLEALVARGLAAKAGGADRSAVTYRLLGSEEAR